METVLAFKEQILEFLSYAQLSDGFGFLILVNCRNEEFDIKQDYAGLVDCLSCSL